MTASFNPSPCEFQLFQTNAAGRPAAAQGTAITPGNNTYSAYVSLGLTLTADAYGIYINFNSIGQDTFATDTLCTLGIDPAGGSAFTDVIMDLACTGAVPYAGSQHSGGIWFYFPIKILGGSSLGLKATQNNASPLNVYCYVVCPSMPKRPDMLPRFGTFVRTFGSVPASSGGTALTPGTTSDGAYVQLGTAIADPLYFFQVALGCNNANNKNEIVHVDLGIGASSSVLRNIIVDEPVGFDNYESVSADYAGAYAESAIGDLLFARAQCSGTAITGLSAIAYGVGGVA